MSVIDGYLADKVLNCMENEKEIFEALTSLRSKVDSLKERIKTEEELRDSLQELVFTLCDVVKKNRQALAEIKEQMEILTEDSK